MHAGTQSQSSGGQRLGDCDLANIIEKIGKYNAKWETIGINLGFKKGELDSIKASPTLQTTAPGSFLQEMIAEWLQWAPTDGHGHDGYATVESLQLALRKAKLGVVAEKFEGYVSINASE